MAHIEFALTDKTFFNAKEKWAKDGKTPEEVSLLTTELLSKRAAEREAQGGNAPLTKFPPWLRDFLREQIATTYNGAKLKWDPENDVLSAGVGADGLEVNDWIGGDLTKAYMTLLADHADFAENFQLHPTIRDSDGNAEMADLENHFRGAAKKDKIKPKQDEEEEAVAEAVEADDDGDDE